MRERIKVVSLGEIMMRLSPKEPYKILQTSSLDVFFGGSEANVAISLSLLGLDSYYITKLPNNDLGEAAFNELRKYGVRLDYVARGGDKLGLYFAEAGYSMRPSKVIYDRKNSAIAEATLEDFDFAKIFEEASHFHFSGITLAISDNAFNIAKEAAKKAKEMGLTVSIDLNYRKKLWSKKEAQEKTALIMPYVDICMGNEEDAANMLGFDMKGSEPEKGIISLETYYDIFKEMKEKFGFKCIATSLRESYSASENAWQGLLYDGKNFYSSKKYKITLVDRLGGGDAFSAALIYSLLKGKEKQKAIDFAVAASALKQTIKGDFNLSYIEDIERLVEGDAMGRIIR